MAKMPRESLAAFLVRGSIRRALVTPAEDAAKNAAAITPVSVACILPVALVVTLHEPLPESLGPRVPVPMRTLWAVVLAATGIA